MPTVWLRSQSRYDSNNNSVAQPQLPPEPNKKRHIESIGESGGGSFPTSPKRPRTLKRPKNAIQETPGFACPLYKHNPSKFGGPRGCADWCTLKIHRLFSNHLKKHAKEDDISYETLDAVKKLKPDIKNSTPEAKAAERWSLTYRYLHKLSSTDKIPSPYYQRRETSFQTPSQHLTPRPESPESSTREPEQQDAISHLSLPPPPDRPAPHSNRSPCKQQHPPDMQVERQLSTRVADGRDQATARLLLKLGAAVEVTDKDGWTPLMRAAEKRHKAVVELLLEMDGVDPDSKDVKMGRTPLSWAAGQEREAVVKLLLEGNDVDPNSEDSIGQTPLLWAAVMGQEAVVKLLLQRDGIDPNTKGSWGRTPLSWAAVMGHEAVVKLLLERDDVNPHSESSSGQTPLSLALEKGHEAIMKLLLARNGVDPGL